eukprot:8507244-Pyramimonas_sp.AAC.1
MAKFKEVANSPTQDNDAREAPEAEPPHEDGRLLIIPEESEADLEAHIMDVWCTEQRGERELLEATP